MNVLFVGLITLDLIYQVEALPRANQKCVAQDLCIAAGGPATNAAIAFASLAQRQTQRQAQGQDERRFVPTVVGCLGQHPLATLVRQDLEFGGVMLLDLASEQATDLASPPPMSSIWVQSGQGDGSGDRSDDRYAGSPGDRTVVSLNATRIQANPGMLPADLLGDVGLVLIDGHQMAIGEAIAQQARHLGIPVVVDGGSWKPGFERVLAHCDVAIASANFFPPGCTTPTEVAAYLHELGVNQVAITRGPEAILAWDQGHAQVIPVPVIQPVDTLGAGDIFHGAFCYYWLQGLPFATALEAAAPVAAIACQSFGTRHWIQALELPDKFKFL